MDKHAGLGRESKRPSREKREEEKGKWRRKRRGKGSLFLGGGV